MDLAPRLLAGGVNDRDLEHVLSWNCPGPARVTGNVVEFLSGDSGDLYARLRYKHGRIQALEPGPALGPDRIDEFIAKARVELAQSHGSKVLRRTLLSDYQLVGHWTHDNLIALRPTSGVAPIGAGLDWFAQAGPYEPEATHLGPPFPLLLEVRVPRSPNALLEGARGLRLLDQYEYLLGVILVGRVRGWSTSAERTWTLVRNEDKGITNHLLHTGFNLSIPGESDDFLPIGSLSPITEVVSDDYYSRLGLGDRILTVPTNVGSALRAFDSLQEDARARYLRAIYWYAQANRMWDTADLAIVALATAIECLLPETAGAPCVECKRPTGEGPSAAFLKVTKRYGVVSPSLRRRRADIYRVRSKLVHGRRASRVDIGFLSARRATGDDLLLTDMVTKRSLINWLLDASRD